MEDNFKFLNQEVLQQLEKINEAMKINFDLTQPVRKQIEALNRSIEEAMSVTGFAEQLRETMINFEGISQSFEYSNYINSVLESMSGEVFANLRESLTFNRPVIEGIDEYNSSDQHDHEDVSNEEYEDIYIKRPMYYDTAIKLNLIITTTDDQVDNNEVSESEKKQWLKYIRPVLIILMEILLAWAFSDTSIQNSNIYEAIQKLIEYTQQLEVPSNKE